MQDVSSLYKQIYGSRRFYVESSLVICENTVPLSYDDPDDGYREDRIIGIDTNRNVFPNGVPEVGQCTCSEITIQIYYGSEQIPEMARITPYIRLVSNINGQMSEWIRKGVYFVDTREITKNDDGLKILTLHGFDAMLKADTDYPWSSVASPTDIYAVNTIATAIGVTVDPRTVEIINKSYEVVAPIGYTMRETLGHIAGAYGGNFIINDLGMLQLICLWDLPEESNLLTDEDYNCIVFGEDRIVLGD